MTAGAELHDGKIYITGIVYRPSSLGIDPHIHAWGVDSKGRTVFFKTTSVIFIGGNSFNRTESYVVSVRSSTFAKAAVVYVTFHSQSDAQSEKND